MKLAHHKASEHLKKRRAMQSGERMVADIEFVENELPIVVSEMGAYLKERERMRDKITELLRRIQKLEAKHNAGKGE